MTTFLLKADQAEDCNPMIIGSPVRWHERIDAERQARQILTAAEQKAAEVMKAAHRQAAAMRRRARQEGRRAGMAEAAHSVSQALLLKNRATEDLLPELVDLAVRMTERILGHSLQRDPGIVEDICLRVMRENQPGKEMVLHVNPADMDRISARRLLSQLGLDAVLSVQADPEVGPGGCRIRSELGVVDGRLFVQLQQLRLALAAHPGADDRLESGPAG